MHVLRSQERTKDQEIASFERVTEIVFITVARGETKFLLNFKLD